MPTFRNDPEDEEDTLFDDVTKMADKLGLQGKNRANYIDDHMTQMGYERVQTRDSYAKPRAEEDPEDAGTSRWFGRGRAEDPARQPQNPRPNPRDDDDRY